MRDQIQCLDTRRTYDSNVTDRNDCDGLNQWVTTCCEEALNALIDLEILVEVMGTRLPTKHVAGEDLTTDLTGSDVMLQETEAMTGSLTGLDEILSTTDKLPPPGGDVGTLTEFWLRCSIIMPSKSAFL